MAFNKALDYRFEINTIFKFHRIIPGYFHMFNMYQMIQISVL